MDKPKLSPSVEQRMQVLCRKIAVAHDLDAEIQRELYGHMEDKLLAYLAGEELITEDDALILVQAHFGDPATLKDCLREVHTVPATLSLLRRLLAIVVLTAGVSFSFSLVLRTVGLLLFSFIETEAQLLTPISTVFASGAILLTLFGQPILIGWILRHWQRSLDRGETLWAYELSAGRAALLGAGVLTVWSLQALPSLWLLNDAPLHGEGLSFAVKQLFLDPVPMLFHMEGGPVGIVVLGALLSAALKAALWFWWCDRPPRTLRTLNLASTAWLVFVLAPALVESACVQLALFQASHSIHGSLLQMIFVGGFAMALYRANRRRVERGKRDVAPMHVSQD